ncbi:two pore potassium channel protein sup-9 [Anoplophora glabripennis]|uniref:two pore potassium channel protein sup-9 n=1 Tax=Anoplophora glabripennis TaxID=217634 RepID=UPI0008745F67|nr:two pore potassium channel protein sup-9 [Anoplophora glabripennis]
METYYLRGSSRSRGSSSASDVDPREKIKECCRKLIAFMCTQVGVGALVFGYTLIGAVTFMHIEEKGQNTKEGVMNETRINYSMRLYETALIVNGYNITTFAPAIDEVLKDYQKKVVEIFKDGYDPQDEWTFPSALMFSLSIITMIGYGNMVPKTGQGRLATVIYAGFGIPLYILYFMNVGDALAGCFRCVYRWIYECSSENEDDPRKRIIVPSTACLWVIGAYVLTGAIMFGAWEHWNFLDSIYFCVTSLCKLGFGDLVPGSSIDASNHANQTKLVINFIYIAFGLGLVAMCYNLMREEIREKVKEVREDFTQCLEDTRVRLVEWSNRCRGIDEDFLYN